jgi:hypothetical protein
MGWRIVLILGRHPWGRRREEWRRGHLCLFYNSRLLDQPEVIARLDWNLQPERQPEIRSATTYYQVLGSP